METVLVCWHACNELRFLDILPGHFIVCIHAKNWQRLLIEIYKSINYLRSSFVWKFHEKKCVEYNLRTENLCKSLQDLGWNHCLFKGSFLWNTVDGSIRNEPTLLAFKNKIENWSGKQCTCRICG